MSGYSAVNSVIESTAVIEAMGRSRDSGDWTSPLIYSVVSGGSLIILGVWFVWAKYKPWKKYKAWKLRLETRQPHGSSSLSPRTNEPAPHIAIDMVASPSPAAVATHQDKQVKRGTSKAAAGQDAQAHRYKAKQKTDSAKASDIAPPYSSGQTAGLERPPSYKSNDSRSILGHGV